MYKKDVIEYFKQVQVIADKLSINSAAISQWGDVIPEKQALKLNRITKGRLKYNAELYS